ncbi:family 4 glycosyl hydrolase, alpha-galactosidase/6-phospho-beta-glucosidase [Thermobacillus composti KWC4]|uniref:Family 4 glycosyl hydrolase, alpha-galactosidase/6-phospho-beta-glucosidase n=1 Tax=Thermobacillus composti (strain DSM 18247 / JCM 13945 / KWC4) TaxID=717605 RepID=L0EET3_THECK|nr:alpha-glucosidase/alpha-galactosidase [Thermobacillus composti]AGA57655.1 family 4 glycosyl hydrolase, alpha-galactosidase/6-phospho-beta-glucosidase [Thermobacillus composti KWC4]
MSFKVTFIGAGSIGFTRSLLRDLLSVPEFRNIRVAFTDISERNLEMVRQLCQRDIDENGLSIRIEATTDRREALKDAKYVLNTIRVGGLEAFQTDIDIPLRYGVDQCVGDTLCAGGIMYGQRGIAVMLDICKDIREVAAKDALLLNYANPMAMLTWACNKYGGVRTIGLCHGVQHGHKQIADVFGLKKEEVDIICAGINHQTWYIQIRHKGRDLTGELLEAFERHPVYSRTEKVRIDMLRRFGYYSTESNGHLSEYVPWYRKRPEEIRDWIDLGSWINGETGGYLRVCTEGRNWFETDFPNWLKEPPLKFRPEDRGYEHGSFIIESLETGRVYRGHFNVVNGGVISNLPDDAIVEVPGYVDANGISIPHIGDLPLGPAAVCNASISVQRLAVEAAVRGDDFLLRQAFMMDPLVGAVCNPKEIWQMVDEMLVAQEQWLPQYKEAIAAAKARLEAGRAAGTLIPTRDYQGAARLKVKTVEEMERDREEATKNAAAADKGQDREKAKH